MVVLGSWAVCCESGTLVRVTGIVSLGKRRGQGPAANRESNTLVVCRMGTCLYSYQRAPLPRLYLDQSKATIRPWLAYLFQVRSTADSTSVYCTISSFFQRCPLQSEGHFGVGTASPISVTCRGRVHGPADAVSGSMPNLKIRFGTHPADRAHRLSSSGCMVQDSGLRIQG